jgi:hypothetical protein
MSGIQQLLLGGSVQQAVDPYFYSVTSLLHGDGTNGGQNNTFLDSSTNNFTITRNGNTTQGSFSPFSQTGWSNYFDGATATRLTMPSNTAFAFGTGAYTVEAWVYLSAHAATQTTVFDCGSATNSLNFSILSTGALSLGVFGVGPTLSSAGGAVTLNAWNHVAVVRESTASNATKLYVNGTAVATGTDTGNYSVTTTPAIGGLNSSGFTATGYISNVRLVKGTAVYTANFTPSTTPLTAISGTSLLTCQANRFRDASTNNFTITRNGDVSVQPFSPFNPTTPYSTSSIGGSGYFDGSGDYLTAPTNLVYSADFCAEAWFYTSTTTTYASIYSDENGSAGATILLNNGSANGQITVYMTGIVSNFASTSTGLNNNAWHHVAVTRSGSTVRLFIDGKLENTATASGTCTGGTMIVGASYYASRNWLGYIANFRIVLGAAVYTAAFTPPTAPLTAISGTQFLLNYTNGAIFDNAAVADYETVGNAQISTSVKKYGTGSMAFDGTGDYLVTDAPSTQLMTFGTGDFTVEFWLYVAVFPSAGEYKIIYDSRPTSTNGLYPTITLKGSTLVYFTNSADRITSGSISATTWYHVALCRAASQTKLFINGTQVGSTYADTNSYINGASRPLIGDSGSAPSGTNGLNGYIDDLRISKGIGRYAYNFTPPTAEFPNIGGTVTLTADPYFDYTTLLLPGNGTNGAQNNTFLDSSTNNFTITRNGNTTQGTFSPFSQTGWSNYFDGSGDSITTGTNAAFQFGTGNFTVEGWVYPSATAIQCFFDNRTSDASSGGFFFGTFASNQLAIYTAATAISGGTVPTNTWSHVAVVRNGSTWTLYLNGTSVATYTSSANLTDGNSQIGASTSVSGSSSNFFTGYMSNVRVVKGTAVYTSNFTPSITPLTAISGTSLLTCQSNRFIDNSTNAFAITRNGDVSVQAFSPFNPTAAWSASTNGGSGYFDGSGDYLTVADNAALELGASNFCVELFYYPTSVSGGRVLIGKRTTPASDYGFVFFADSATMKIFISSGNSSYDISNGVSIGTLVTNQWHHIAVYRVGNAWYGSFNGVITTLNASNSSAVWNNSAPWAIGAESNATSPTVGYMSDVRFVIGSSVYTGSSAPVPTAPLTAVTNTSLLLNYTNAGIYDATSKNDLETVGNAQISTAQSKFGGSSMLFDGSGDYLVAPPNVDTDFGSGDFTAEAWVYPSSLAAAQDIFGKHADSPVGNSTVGLFIYVGANNSSNEAGIVSGNTVYNVTGWSLTAGTWQHIAFTRYAGSLRFFINGVQVGATVSANVSINSNSAWRTWIGTYTAASRNWNGYLQDVRFTKGIARYTSNFTPPTTAFLTL